MSKIFFIFIAVLSLSSCNNSSDFDTGEIKIVNHLRTTLLTRSEPRVLLDTKQIITREKIDKANIPVLFVELENGQNGTLTLYPGQGIGETWLGADGATITLEKGILKATRGMKNDLMGSLTSMPAWEDIVSLTEYTRHVNYLDGNNQTFSDKFICQIKTDTSKSSIEIFNVAFTIQKYNEVCHNHNSVIKNSYFIDEKGTVRRSIQYHGNSLGYILIERLDR